MVDTAPLTKDKGSRDWDKHVFECFSNPLMCLWACFMPCGANCMQAVSADLMFKNSNPNAKYMALAMGACLCCLGAAYNRERLRVKFDIKGNYVLDCLLWLLLPCCSVTQEWRTVMAEYYSDENYSICQVFNTN